MNILPVTYLEEKFIVNSEQSLPVNPEILEQIHPQPGQGFDLGLRPEFVTLLGENELKNVGRLTAVIDVVEPLGREILVRAIIIGSKKAIYFHTHPHWRGKRGDRLNLSLDLNHLFLFDPSSGELSYGNSISAG